jgi:DNA invertase Pin-like site-specific DNA recombinase
MSTDHQRYSTENQSAVIHAYAAAHGMHISRTYRDEGKSGLDIGGRKALRRLLHDVQSGQIDFEVILVYDVSRWGRFQNTDESAHYEYLCTNAGIKLIYCAEPFDNDGTPLATIYKGIKRSMAGEYSRELSAKVFAGHCRLVKLGFHQGGTAGFGLRRALLDENKNFKGELSHRQHKSIQTDRVILIPGPEAEVEVVQRIFRQFVHLKESEQGIADSLNADSLKSETGNPWTRGTVHQILTSERYIGNNVYNKTSTKLRSPTRRNPHELWIRQEGAFQGIVSLELFENACAIIAGRSQLMDDAKMLAMLRTLLSQAGMLSGLLIDEQLGMPSSTAYSKRFGGLIRAYSLVGYSPERDYRYLATNQLLRQWRPLILEEIIARLRDIGADVVRDQSNDLLSVNGEWTASIIIVRCQAAPSGSLRWRLRFDSSLAPDITIAVRMDHANERALDYFLVPRLEMRTWPQRLSEVNNNLIDSYRFDTLDVLEELALQSPAKESL